jgi:aldehyde:ferredoxin oxidoreductase
MRASILKGTDGCFACPIRCKREVSAPEPFESDAAYGGPEYETIASFGSLCEVADLGAVSKAHELCNAYGLDTISTGSVVAFAMECYENSLLTDSETGSMQLRFGNTEAMLQLVEMIAYRKGIGNILADGVKLASEKIGKGSARFALHVKGKELPMHDPRGKKGVALGYAVSPSGADHMQAVHDPVFVNPPKSLEALGIFGSIAADSLGGDKVRAFLNAHLWWGLLDCLGCCKFVFIPHNVGILTTDDLVDLVNASTGFNMSLWSLMKASERALNLTRCFNVREGFTAKDDKVPERFFEGLRFGSRKGAKLKKQEFDEALSLYYEMMGWDSGTGIPTAGKLHELDLEWVTHEMGLA